MKKQMIITGLLLWCASFARAQTWDEWFNQKATQKKYLLEQIAAYKVYLDYLKKGYDIYQDGTQVIGDIKSGDSGLHHDYFSSLGTVNPKIRNYDKVQDILSMQKEMMDERRTTLRLALQSGQFTSQETVDLKALYNRLNDEASKDIDELTLTISDGKLQLSDDERIRRIELLYAAVQGRQSVQRKLNKNVLAIASGRKRDGKDMETLRGIYGIR